MIKDKISESIETLRQLTQVNLQADWRCCLADLAVSEATQPQLWQQWAIADLNARDHIAWPAGQQVLWLGQRLVIPPDLQGYPLQGMTLRLVLTWWADSAQIFVNGQQVQAGDLFDCSTRILLSPAVVPAETIAVAIRLVSPGHDQGALVKSRLVFESSQPDAPEPGFVADELAVLQSYLSNFEPEKLDGLWEVIAQINWLALSTEVNDSSRQFDHSLATLRQQLQPLSDPIKQRRILLLGHAHLDLAWLWPVSETWEAAENTFKSVLQLQKEFPNLIFCHSTPALYAWIEANRPELFAAIQQQVAAGRWEIVAGLWVEPEFNLVSGESIVRQVLYGQRYVQEKFGKLSAIAWLPDSFGFCWQLPQILRQGGVEFFTTQKLRWNDTTQFPYEAFWWRSPDGTEIFSVMTPPIGEGIDPIKMATYAGDWEAKTGIPTALWLPGVGDHGGGPSRDMLEVAQRWQQSPFFPRLEFTTAIDYLKSLSSQQQSSEVSVDSNLLPLWHDELYLEFHRGCYTTHAEQKRWNRRCEGLLYQAELLASLATLSAGADYPKLELEAAWKKVLFNQFHDILPGSSIPQVFVDANQGWMAAEQVGSEILNQALRAIAAQIALPPPPDPKAQPILVFNSLNWPRSEVVEIVFSDLEPGQSFNWKICDLVGQEMPSQRRFIGPKRTSEGEKPIGSVSFLAKDIPAVGYRIFWLSPLAPASKSSQLIEEYVLENESLRVVIDSRTGDIFSIFDKSCQCEVLKGAGNQLQAFEDKGQYWDAWNIDPNYTQHPLPPAELCSIAHLEQGDLRTRIRVVRKIGHSTFWQDYILQSGSAVLKIETTVDWQERQTLVKAAFSFNLESDQATYEIPYGAIARPTRPANPHEQAKWEVPALHWADLSTSEYGVSLLNDCKYGYDSQPNQLRLTLLRSPNWPDPEADRGWHQFTYAIYPHPAGWQSAHTVRRGYELNFPLQVMLSAQGKKDFSDFSIAREPLTTPTLPPVGKLLDLQAENLILSALKQAEDHPNQWILRCYECHGEVAKLDLQSDLEIAIAHPVDLLERSPHPLDSANGQAFEVGPWKIASFSVIAAANRETDALSQ